LRKQVFATTRLSHNYFSRAIKDLKLYSGSLERMKKGNFLFHQYAFREISKVILGNAFIADTCKEQ